MAKQIQETIWEGQFLGLYRNEDGTPYLGVSDGVGFVGTESGELLEGLYEGLKKVLNK